eukprot:2265260-Amphidinium_carterae.2
MENEGPMGTGEATRWLLNFLSLAKVDPLPQEVFGSHSLKATWTIMARRGLPSTLRRLLGQHRKDGRFKPDPTQSAYE